MQKQIQGLSFHPGEADPLLGIRALADFDSKNSITLKQCHEVIVRLLERQCLDPIGPS